MKPSVILAASPGGHLAELVSIVERLVSPTYTKIWVTHPSDQIKGLLGDDMIVQLPYTAPRDVVGTLRNAGVLLRRIGQTPISGVLTSGASVGLSALLAAAAKRVPAHYVELAARSEGPSLSGKVAQRFPGTRVYTQYPSWDRPGWVYCGSVFDEFASRRSPRSDSPRSFLVTVGLNSYGFDRLLTAADAVIPPDAEVTWQTGSSSWTPTRGAHRPSIGSDALARIAADSDVVISHSGTGSALAALRAGKRPILIPRRAAQNEHVDDHQVQISRDLVSRSLAFEVDPDHLRLEHLTEAFDWLVDPAPRTTPLVSLEGLS
jgi:UDP-N-acetylglucosamine--N-acetylmuramyl-(pentapeptide) pyrophosphoryl-undecaprenol N-acetylglucosamine transferase